MTNRKMHMCFRLTPKRSMTLDDVEFAISSNFLEILRDFADLGGNNGYTAISDRIVGN